MSIKIDVQKILLDTSDVTDKVTPFVLGGNTYHMIFSSRVVPETIDTDNGDLETKATDSTIIHYMSGTVNNAIPFNTTRYTVSCRAYDQDDCLELQLAAFEAFARVRGNSGNTYFTAEMLPLLPPTDNTDNWLGVVELKAMGSLN